MKIPAVVALIILFFVLLVVFHVLERLFPIHGHYRTGPGRRGYFADLIASLIDGPTLSSATKIVAFTLVTHAPQIYDLMGAWPFWVQFAVFFIVNDFARYWLHRLHHEVEWLWRIHRVHHATVEMDALSTMRVHVLESVLKYGLIVMPFHMLGVHIWVVATYSAIDLAKGFWHHANLRTYIGPLNYFFNSAEQHWWHHSIEARGQRANYGSVLSIWDRLFGTFYWPRGEWPKTIGVEGLEHFPDDYLRQAVTVLHSDQELIDQLAGRPSRNATADNATAASGQNGLPSSS